MYADELNLYIRNYLENDKTNSAIMLSGPWGSGKSHYIKKQLIPHLEEKQKDSCIIISLYGIKDLREISKSIYLERRAKTLKRNSEGAVAGKIVAKTIFKGVTSFFGVDLKSDEADLQALYESIDLTGKLVILEDLERCSIDVIEVLGFVNNLVEQDGVKVLLVANEDEIHHDEYLRKKEKVVNDTLSFVPQIHEPLRNIVGNFFVGDVQSFLTKAESINEIAHVMQEVNAKNFRSVIFACQKIGDIIHFFEKPLTPSFVLHLLCSAIAFSCRMKKGEDCTWKDETKSPQNLGTPQYPLYKICYDYIKEQYFSKENLEATEQMYLKNLQHKNAETEYGKCLNILYHFYRETEVVVSKAVEKIKGLLEENHIPLGQYGELANYLFAVRDCIANTDDIEMCKIAMLKNIREIDGNAEIETSISFHSGIHLDTEKQMEEFISFKKNLIEELKGQRESVFEFSSCTAQNFLEFVQANYQEGRVLHCLAREIEIPVFLEWIQKCTAEEIDMIRYAFRHVYSLTKANEYMTEDGPFLETLVRELNILKSDCQVFDRIQKKQISWFIGNLNEVIERLSIKE